jgi:asparagine synthase (glutamine-hydrolysing)
MEWLWSKMIESVKNRLISKNYPISLLISGGLDSSIIAAILEGTDSDVTWYSIENGESEFVNMLAEKFDKKVNFLQYEMDENLNQEIYQYWNETPIDLGSVVPQYHLFDAIKKGSNTRIVISGDGADELFGGYRRINEYDSQQSDIFHELSYYHLPRLDKLSMAHTLELRSPFLNHDIVRFALSLPFEERKNKKILKDTFKGLVPDSVIERSKLALKNSKIIENQIEYRKDVVRLFLESSK